jgi:hypothetical protein
MPGLNQRTLSLMANTLSLDHRGQLDEALAQTLSCPHILFPASVLLPYSVLP